MQCTLQIANVQQNMQNKPMQLIRRLVSILFISEMLANAKKNPTMQCT